MSRPIRPMTAPQLGSLTWLPAAERPDLLGRAGGRRAAAAAPARPGSPRSTTTWPTPRRSPRPTACRRRRRPTAWSWPPAAAGQTTLAACLVLATTRADVNGLVRRHLGARKASFAPQDVAVAESGMAYGGHHPGRAARRPGRCWSTPRWPPADCVVIGSGTRGSKLAVPGCGARRPAGRRGARGARPAAARRGAAGPGAEPPRPRAAPDDSDVGWGERPRGAGRGRPPLPGGPAAALGQRLIGQAGPVRAGRARRRAGAGPARRAPALLGAEQVADLDQQLDLGRAGRAGLLAALAPLEERLASAARRRSRRPPRSART